MKKFFSIIGAWIKSHVWQSVVIGVVAVAAIGCAITLPIVLSNSNDQPTEQPSEEHKEDPTPTPVPITYVVSKADVTNGTLTLSDSGSFEAGKEITVTATANEGYTLKNITINGETKSTKSTFIFTVSQDLADSDKKIVVGATFEEKAVPVTGIEITGPEEVSVGESITLSIIFTPTGATPTGEITWYIVEGAEYISLPDTKTGNTIVVTGEFEGTGVVKASYDDLLYSQEFSITVTEN